MALVQDTEEMNDFRLSHLGIVFESVEGESIAVSHSYNFVSF
jgi:hypothetical protein